MTNPVDSRKQILFIASVLGIMVGVSVYLVYKAVLNQNFALLAILPALLLTSIPMLNALRRLRGRQRSGD